MAEFVYFRYVLVVVAFYCMIVVNLTRSDFNVTILKMIDNSPNCTDNKNSSSIPDTFCWSKEIEEALVASYFIGYTLQLPGGLLANAFGAYYVCGLGMLVTIVLSFLTPLAAWDWRVLLVVRVVQGMGAAPTFPALTALWTKWAPRHERSTLFSITVAGHFIGAVLADALSGVLCEQSGVLGGSWPSVFRIFGIIGMLWFVIWMTFASSDPDQNIWTSLDEKDYIKLNRMPLRRNRSVPWLWVLTSTKCWAIYIAHFCSYFGYLTMLIGYPQYFKDVHEMKIDELGAISSIPILAMFLTSIIAGKVTDTVLKREIVSTTAARKINTIIGMIIPAALNFVIAFVSNLSLTAVIVIMTLQNAANGFVLSGFQVNYIDINPDHAGVTIGLGNSMASVAGIIVPILLYRFSDQAVGLGATGNAAQEWKMMFISVGIAMTFGCLVFCIMGTGKRQLEGMEDYIEIGGTDSEAEATTNRQTEDHTSVSPNVDSGTDMVSNFVNDPVVGEQCVISEQCVITAGVPGSERVQTYYLPAERPGKSDSSNKRNDSRDTAKTYDPSDEETDDEKLINLADDEEIEDEKLINLADDEEIEDEKLIKLADEPVEQVKDTIDKVEKDKGAEPQHTTDDANTSPQEMEAAIISPTIAPLHEIKPKRAVSFDTPTNNSPPKQDVIVHRDIIRGPPDAHSQPVVLGPTSHEHSEGSGKIVGGLQETPTTCSEKGTSLGRNCDVFSDTTDIETANNESEIVESASVLVSLTEDQEGPFDKEPSPAKDESETKTETETETEHDQEYIEGPEIIYPDVMLPAPATTGSDVSLNTILANNMM